MDKELLAAIGQMIDEKLTPIQQDISGMKQGIAGLKQDVSGLKQDVSGLKQDVSGLKQEVAEIKQEVVKINLRIENDITKKLESLADGYALNYEKQSDLECRVEALEVKVG